MKSLYFDHFFTLLVSLGVNIRPIEDEFLQTISTVYSAAFVGIFCYVFTIFEGMDLFIHFTDLNTMTMNFPYFLTHLLGSVKVTLFIWIKKSVWNFSCQLEEEILQPNLRRGGEIEFQLINRAKKISIYQAAVFNSLVFLIVLNTSLHAAFDEGIFKIKFDVKTNTTYLKNIKTMPFTTWFPFDQNISPFYEICFIFHILGPGFMGLQIGFIDSIICGFMFHLRAQFRILKNTLKVFVGKVEILHAGNPRYHFSAGLEMSDESKDTVRKMTVECVKHHEKILFLCQEAEEKFRYLMLLQFLGSVLILCFHLFQMSLVQLMSVGSDLHFVSMFCYLLLMEFQILTFCWIGNEIQVESGNISNYAYESNWIVVDDKAKKMLLLMMMRAQRPFKFTAGKFAFLSLETFMNIARGSASYFVALRHIQEQ